MGRERAAQQPTQRVSAPRASVATFVHETNPQSELKLMSGASASSGLFRLLSCMMALNIDVSGQIPLSSSSDSVYRPAICGNTCLVSLPFRLICTSQTIYGEQTGLTQSLFSARIFRVAIFQLAHPFFCTSKHRMIAKACLRVSPSLFQRAAVLRFQWHAR